MNVLVNGCSFSRGPNSWPYALQNIIDFDLVNLAQSGAGNTYIHHATVNELVNRSYDLVIIMWSGISRIDCRVEDVNEFNKTPYTSYHQSQRNDWIEKIIEPINDQDYVDKKWVFGNGYMNGDKFLKSIKFLETYYRHCGISEFVNNFLMHVVALQSILKYMQIPYVFSYYADYTEQLIDDPVYQLIDQANVCNNDNITQIMERIQSFDIDGIHPGVNAHKQWAEVIYKYLNL